MMTYNAKPGTIDVWQINLNTAFTEPDKFLSLFDDREKQRYQRLHQSKQLSFFISHLACREILARYCHLAATDIRYQYNQHGKPALQNTEQNIEFNLSHSGQLALLAITPDLALGVDIEYKKQRSSWQRLARRFFAEAEISYILAQPDNRQLDAFYQIWTHKEAYIKATGSGMSTQLPSFSVIHNNNFEICDHNIINDQPFNCWYQADLNIGDNYKAAVVAKTPIIKIQYFNYENLLNAEQTNL